MSLSPNTLIFYSIFRQILCSYRVDGSMSGCTCNNMTLIILSYCFKLIIDITQEVLLPQTFQSGSDWLKISKTFLNHEMLWCYLWAAIQRPHKHSLGVSFIQK